MCFHLFPTPCSGTSSWYLKSSNESIYTQDKVKNCNLRLFTFPTLTTGFRNGSVFLGCFIVVVVVFLQRCSIFFSSCSLQFSSVQSLSRVRLFVTPWIAAHQASLSITNSWSLPKLMPIQSVMPSSHLILWHPLLLLPLIPPSIRVFPKESTLHMRWPKYRSFSFNISPSNEHPGLISFISLQSKGLSRVLPTSQFKSINSLALSFLQSPTVTSLHYHGKNHSLD